MNIKTTFAAVAIVAAGAMGTSLAQAHTDVRWSVSIGVPLPVYVQPAPVYVEPAPVYVEPRPVYVQPAPVYVRPEPVYSGYGYRYPTRWDRDERHHHERHWDR